MKILLLGECYSTNLGDALICETVEKIIKRIYPNSIVDKVDVSGRIPEGYYNVFADFKRMKIGRYLMLPIRYTGIVFREIAFARLRNLLRYARALAVLENKLKENKYDVALFAGGQLFYDYFVDVLYCLSKRLNKEGIDIVFHSCGMGETSARTCRLFKKMFRFARVKSISVRDYGDKFAALFPDIDFVRTFDTALCASDFYEANKKKVADVGIGVLATESAKSSILNIIKYLQKHTSRTWRLFTNGNPNDEKMAEEILGVLGLLGEKSDFLLNRPQNAAELVRNVTSFDRIISFRMHSQIVSASFGIPCIGLSWDGKVKELYRQLGISDWVGDEVVNELECAKLLKLLLDGEPDVLSKVLEQREHAREQLLIRLAPYSDK